MSFESPTLPAHVPHLTPLGKDALAELATANLFFESGSWEKASHAYQLVLEQEPTQAISHLYLAKCRFQLHQYDEAKLSCQRALQLNPKLAAALALRGHLHLRDEEFAQAQESYLQAIETDPEQASAHAMLGHVYWKQRMVVLAQESYMTAVRLDSTQFFWWVALAEIANEADDPLTAQWASQKALEINPLLIRAHYQLGVAYQKRGEWKKAESAFAQASSASPARILGILNRARILAQTEGSAPVIPLIDVCQAMYPNWAQLPIVLGEAYLTDSNFEMAVKTFQKAIKLQPSLAEPYYKIGLSYLRLDRRTEAKESFELACDRSTPPSPAHVALEQILREKTT